MHSEILYSRKTISSLEANISRKDSTMIVRKEVELEAALKEKDSIILGMREQLTKTREYLAMKQQISNVQQ